MRLSINMLKNLFTCSLIIASFLAFGVYGWCVRAAVAVTADAYEYTSNFANGIGRKADLDEGGPDRKGNIAGRGGLAKRRRKRPAADMLAQGFKSVAVLRHWWYSSRVQGTQERVQFPIQSGGRFGLKNDSGSPGDVPRMRSMKR
jgi:hypothetical protein